MYFILLHKAQLKCPQNMWSPTDRKRALDSLLNQTLLPDYNIEHFDPIVLHWRLSMLDCARFIPQRSIYIYIYIYSPQTHGNFVDFLVVVVAFRCCPVHRSNTTWHIRRRREMSAELSLLVFSSTFVQRHMRSRTYDSIRDFHISPRFAPGVW